MAAGAVAVHGATPAASYLAADTAAQTLRENADTATQELREIIVSKPVSRRVVRMDRNGLIGLSANSLAEQPSFMGGGDAVGLIRALPYVTTSAELQASLSVRGGSGGDNLFESDGVRVVNPMHMLGFYSTFNPAFYKGYSFRAGRFDALTASCTGGYMAAQSTGEPDPDFSGTVSAGLIESHGAVSVPLRKGTSSVKVGVRHNYISKIFPHILKLGATALKYGFTDANTAVAWRPDSLNLFNATVFYNRDRMTSDDRNHGRQYGRFGWENLCGSVTWQHDGIRTMLAASNYSNSFILSEGGREFDMPSRLTQLTARTMMPAGKTEIEADVNYRYSSGQYNRSLAGSFATASRAFEGNAGIRYLWALPHNFTLEAGLRLSIYACGDYTAFRPQPRLTLSKNSGALYVFASYNRLCRFDALVEESGTSMPADFWINAGKNCPPADVHSFETGVTGYIAAADIRFIAEGYCRYLRHSNEFDGTLLDMLNPGFNPAEHLLDGKGYAAGLSVAVFRQWGRLRGRLSYNLGVARLKFDKFGDRYFPAPHDRLHDLSVNLSFDILNNLTAAVSYVHATGTPFTEARYGYMVGENLICEYFPHNSSRLPAYNRMDVSLTWRLPRHSTVNVSVYNAAACRNILFQYTSYSADEGIFTRKSVMNAIIPSITYAYAF